MGVAQGPEAKLNLNHGISVVISAAGVTEDTPYPQPVDNPVEKLSTAPSASLWITCSTWNIALYAISPPNSRLYASHSGTRTKVFFSNFVAVVVLVISEVRLN